jgi:hypothetical protein
MVAELPHYREMAQLTETRDHELPREWHDMLNSGVCDKQEMPRFYLNREKGCSVKTERFSRNEHTGFECFEGLH